MRYLFKMYVLWLVLSSLVFIAVTSTVVVVWYGLSLAVALQVGKLLAIAFAAHAVVLLLLVLWLCRPQRKDLKQNVFLILSVQVLFTISVVALLAQLRPAWLLLQNKTIYVVTPYMANYASNKTFAQKLLLQSWTRPQWREAPTIGVASNGGSAFTQFGFSEKVNRHIEQYKPLNPSSVLAVAKPVAGLYELGLLSKVQITQDYAQKAQLYIIINSPKNYQNTIALFNAKGEILGIEPFAKQ